MLKKGKGFQQILFDWTRLSENKKTRKIAQTVEN